MIFLGIYSVIMLFMLSMSSIKSGDSDGTGGAILMAPILIFVIVSLINLF